MRLTAIALVLCACMWLSAADTAHLKAAAAKTKFIARLAQSKHHKRGVLSAVPPFKLGHDIPRVTHSVVKPFVVTYPPTAAVAAVKVPLSHPFLPRYPVGVGHKVPVPHPHYGLKFPHHTKTFVTPQSDHHFHHHHHHVEPRPIVPVVHAAPSAAPVIPLPAPTIAHPVPAPPVVPTALVPQPVPLPPPVPVLHPNHHHLRPFLHAAPSPVISPTYPLASQFPYILRPGGAIQTSLFASYPRYPFGNYPAPFQIPLSSTSFSQIVPHQYLVPQENAHDGVVIEQPNAVPVEPTPTLVHAHGQVPQPSVHVHPGQEEIHFQSVNPNIHLHSQEPNIHLHPVQTGVHVHGYPDIHSQPGLHVHGQPEISLQPSQPGFNLQPIQPDYHLHPGHTEVHQQPGQPEFHLQPSHPDIHSQPGQPDYNLQPGQPDYNLQPGQPDYHLQPGQPDYHIQPGQTSYNFQPGQPDFHSQTGQSDYHLQPGQPDYHFQPGVQLQPTQPTVDHNGWSPVPAQPNDVGHNDGQYPNDGHHHFTQNQGNHVFEQHSGNEYHDYQHQLQHNIQQQIEQAQYEQRHHQLGQEYGVPQGEYNGQPAQEYGVPQGAEGRSAEGEGDGQQLFHNHIPLGLQPPIDRPLEHFR